MNVEKKNVDKDILYLKIKYNILSFPELLFILFEFQL